MSGSLAEPRPTDIVENSQLSTWDVWLKNVELLVVPAVVMGGIMIAQMIAPASTERKNAKAEDKGASQAVHPRQSPPKQTRTRSDDFLLKPSPLDADGLILHPWTVSSQTLDVGDTSGWYNLAYLIAVFWFLSSSVANIYRTG